jgi:hypothetical protein
VAEEAKLAPQPLFSVAVKDYSLAGAQHGCDQRAAGIGTYSHVEGIDQAQRLDADRRRGYCGGDKADARHDQSSERPAAFIKAELDGVRPHVVHCRG